MRRIFGITGFKGAGKDTAGLAIRRALGNAEHINFADTLKDVAEMVFGLTPEEMSDRELKEKTLDRYPFMSPRQILQRLGTEAFRNNFPGVWIEAWKRQVNEAFEDGTENIVCTDYRFLDEAEALRSFDATLIKVDRPGFGSDGHASEAGVAELPYDFHLSNARQSASEFGDHAVQMLRTFGYLPPAPTPICNFTGGPLVVEASWITLETAVRDLALVCHIGGRVRHADGTYGKLLAVDGAFASVLWDSLSEPTGCPVCDITVVTMEAAQ